MASFEDIVQEIDEYIKQELSEREDENAQVA